MIGSICEIRSSNQRRTVLVIMMLGMVRIINIRLRRCHCNMEMKSYGCGAQFLGLVEDIKP